MTPAMASPSQLMMVVTMAESGVSDAPTTGHAPTRSNVTMTLPSFRRRRWARAVNRRAQTTSPRLLATSSSLPSVTSRS
jgi:hypothetical protein